MAVTLTVAMAASLIFILLLLPMASAAIAPTSETMKFLAKDVRKSIKESAKDYMEQNAPQRSEQQIASAEAASSGALVFDLFVGTSLQTIPVVMDITSDLVWVQSVPCPTCNRLTPPSTLTFLPNNSESVDTIRCTSETCRRMIPGDGDDDGCRQDRQDDGHLCWYAEDFLYRAGNTSGFLITDTFNLGTTSVPDVVFGCSLDITVSNLTGASGFAGFSKGPRSLVSQLDIFRFTYYIVPLDDPAAKSFVSWSSGAAWDIDIGTVSGGRGGSTPLQAARENQNPDLYYVKLNGVQVDGQLLTAIPSGTFDVRADGSGGVYLSTTLPVTYLQEEAYRVLRQEFVSRFQSEGITPVNIAGDDVRHLCFLTTDFAVAKVPSLALVFDGAVAVMELKVENYFLAANSEQTCLTILPWRTGTVLGSLLQAGRNMTYDIHGVQLTFQTAAAGAPAVSGAPVLERVSLIIMATILVLVLGPRSIF